LPNEDSIMLFSEQSCVSSKPKVSQMSQQRRHLHGGRPHMGVEINLAFVENLLEYLGISAVPNE
jgi:hypothetical protein